MSNAGASNAPINLGPEVLLDSDVESFLGHLPSPGATVTIRVAEHGLPNEGLFVSTLGLLASLRRRGTTIHLVLPEPERTAAVPDTILGTTLMLYADVVDPGEDPANDRRSRLMSALSNSRASVSSASSVSFISTNLPGSAAHGDLRLPRVFSSRYFQVRDELELALVPLANRFRVALTTDQLEHILTFTQEGIENAREHGYLTRDHLAIPGLRFVRFRILSAAEVRKAQAPLSHYLNRLSEAATADVFLEITIADPGRGISATMTNDDAVDEWSLELERSRFTLALRPGGTSKTNRTGAGRGLVMMTRAIHELRGFMAFRTGRLFVCRHFLDAMGRLEPAFFDEGDLTFYRTYDWNETVLSRIEGTHVFCLVPLHES